MRVFIVLALVALASAGNVRVKGTFEKADFAAYKAKHNKSYSGSEENMRHENYLRAIAKINKHNSEYDEGKHTWFQGENAFLDWTPEELESRNGYKRQSVRTGSTYVPQGTVDDSKDWREEGAVNHIKDQGHCGSCWAFGAVASLEGQMFLQKGQLPDCSEQQLVDCDKRSSGCNGGLETWAYDYIKKQGTHGIDTQTSYPYHAKNGHCDTSKTSDEENVCATISGQTHIEEGSETALKNAVGTIGPITVGVYASHWHDYAGGIYDDPSCSDDPFDINHSVCCVGYDTTNNYWIIRNSWGTSWGEEGYIRLVMGKNMCGVAWDCLYPNL